MKEKIICVHKFLGDCPSCSEDFEQFHHPNNLECPMFKKITIYFIEVIERKENESNQNISE